MNDFDEDEPFFESEIRREALQVPPTSDHFREELLSRTSMTVRSRARRRRLARSAAFALAYVLGIATVLLWPRTEPASLEVALGESVAPTLAPALPAAPSPPTELTDEVLNDAEQFALYLKKASPEQKREALKLAGDRYLNDYGDVKLALACYRQLIAAAPPETLREFDLTDTWLLRSLKQDRLQEISHENGNA